MKYTCGKWHMIWICSLTDWSLFSCFSPPHLLTPSFFFQPLWPLTNTSIHYPDDNHDLSIPAEYEKIDFSADSVQDRQWILMASAVSDGLDSTEVKLWSGNQNAARWAVTIVSLNTALRLLQWDCPCKAGHFRSKHWLNDEVCGVLVLNLSLIFTPYSLHCSGKP